MDGDPKASDPEIACFPPALLKDPSGASHEPLAADARKWADGRLLANLKLLSGLLGISLEEMRQRDLKQRQRKWAFTLSLVLVGVVLVALRLYKKSATWRYTAINAAGSHEEHIKRLSRANRLNSLLRIYPKTKEASEQKNDAGKPQI